MLRQRRAVAALALVALIGAGCSDEPSESGDTGTRTETVSARDKGVKFAACMRESGVPDFPDPNAKGDFEFGVNVSPAVWTKAVRACKDLQPPGTLDAKRSPEQQSTALRFADCIRANGVKDFPDPVNGEPLVDTTKIPSTDEPGGMDVLNAAMDTCGDALSQAAGSRP